MTTVGKVIASVFTLGALGGGGILVNKLLDDTDTIGARLTSEGFSISLNNSEWETVLGAHNGINNLEGTFKKDANTALKLDELQEKCKSALNSKKNNDVNYKKARQWCVKEQKISDSFEKINLRALDVTKNTDDTSGWQTNINKLKNDLKTAQKIKAEMNSTQNITLENIKAGCKAIIEIKTTASDFNDKFELAKEWCAVVMPREKVT
ncbi:hypothetical protein A6V39_03470 [Candidatus Mycoplasma haematobovis]|uniref:Uncharacterized protein n=1 Tax=Candidatus Mycoplasma haematobovis TaxID=432608 RepID=A0A1A9QDB4_9MOLU|nr:hypothetical protein [Candidatus Mycoplasma haematobovis]OAL09945.1 hypothetical protein A6V39_03470 [Candidatus Mycoplasma haematobovis]